MASQCGRCHSGHADDANLQSPRRTGRFHSYFHLGTGVWGGGAEALRSQSWEVVAEPGGYGSMVFIATRAASLPALSVTPLGRHNVLVLQPFLSLWDREAR